MLICFSFLPLFPSILLILISLLYRQDTNMSHQRSDTWHRLHIGGLPKEMSEVRSNSLVKC